MHTTASVNQILINTKKNQLISTGINKNITTDSYENDLLFGELGDLVNDNFRAWYCKKFYKLGKEKVLRLAAIARADGSNPQRLFSYLLKRA